MKVAILSSASAGGAGIAAYRIYEALSQSSELEVDFFDMSSLGQVDIAVSPTHSATNGKITNTHFTVDYATEPRQWVIELLSQYDVLNIHWASYLLSLCEIHELAKRGKRILFTMHDFLYITGGCHYPAGCLGFLEGCVGCPQVDEQKCDLHTVIDTQKLKRKIFSYENVHLAAPSAFIVNNAIRSGIVPEHRAHVLRNAYQPIEPFESRECGNKRSILLIADSFDEQRKGLQLAVDSLKLAFSSEKAKVYQLELHLVGGIDKEVIDQLDGLPVRIVTHGHIKQHEKLVQIFKQCQFILTCSYEDNWPNILVEAGSYGCVPIVGKWHGCEEFARQFNSSYVAETYTPSAFSSVISDALVIQLDNLNVLREAINKKIRDNHAYIWAAEKYIQVFNGETSRKNAGKLLNISKKITSISMDRILTVLPIFTSATINATKSTTPFGCQLFCDEKFEVGLEFIKANNIKNETHRYGIGNIEISNPNLINKQNRLQS
tara:strand:+ start:624 stop:2096 length:1473 start_codon:yes stop_codon:yes gene_type:complete